MLHECGRNVGLPKPTSHEWSQDGDQLQAISTTLLPDLKAVLELIKCGCRGSYITMSCSCRRRNLRCTDLCGSCEETCQNRIGEEVGGRK